MRAGMATARSRSEGAEEAMAWDGGRDVLNNH